VFETPRLGRVQCPMSNVQSLRTLGFRLWTLAGLRIFTGLWTHQFARQPIEQFRVRGRLDACAEIFRRRHQTGPEIGLPDSVDEHTGGSRTAGIDEPLGEAQAIAWGVFGKGMQKAGHIGLDFFEGRNRSPRLRTCVTRGSARAKARAFLAA